MVLAFPTKMVLAFPLHPPKKPKYCFNEYKTIQSENTVGANFHTAENIINNLKRYSILSLSRTRKGPKNLLEIEKVRDRENYRKNQNFY